jgi:hypothetical protein
MPAAMSLLPIRTVSLVSELPPASVAGELRGRIGLGAGLPFAGSVAADRFVVTRFREFGPASMPLLRGSLVAAPGGGTGIRLRLRPSNTVVAFMAIWLGFLAAVAAMILAARAGDTGRSLLPLLAPAVLGALSWHLMSAVFAAEARWAVEALITAVPALGAAGRRPDEQVTPGTCAP